MRKRRLVSACLMWLGGHAINLIWVRKLSKTRRRLVERSCWTRSSKTMKREPQRLHPAHWNNHPTKTWLKCPSTEKLLRAITVNLSLNYRVNLRYWWSSGAKGKIQLWPLTTSKALICSISLVSVPLKLRHLSSAWTSHPKNDPNRAALCLHNSACQT